MHVLESCASCFFKIWGQLLTAGLGFPSEHTFPFPLLQGIVLGRENCPSCLAETRQLLRHRGLWVLHYLCVGGLENSENSHGLALSDGDLPCPGKEIITVCSALVQFGATDVASPQKQRGRGRGSDLTQLQQTKGTKLPGTSSAALGTSFPWPF